MFKVNDKVFYRGGYYQVACLTGNGYGLLKLDSNMSVTLGQGTVKIVMDTIDVQPIAQLTYKIGELVQSQLMNKDSKPMTGEVVGYETGNKIVVKSQNSPERVRYSYLPTEVTKYKEERSSKITLTVQDIPESDIEAIKNLFNLLGHKVLNMEVN